MASLESDIQVATACGPGTGRFLAEALMDALQSDQRLVTVREAPEQPPEGEHGVDFVFARGDSDRQEVIRVGLDRDGNVVSTQLLHSTGREPQLPAGAGKELLEAIRAGESISSLHWVADPGAERRLSVTVRLDRQIQIPLI